MRVDNATYVIVLVLGNAHMRDLVSHVDRQSAHVRQLIAEVLEIDEQVHDGVPDLAVHWTSIAHADQSTRVIYNTNTRYKTPLNTRL